MDIFRVLSKGAKFDTKRFSDDAMRFKLSKIKDETSKVVENIKTESIDQLRQKHQIKTIGDDIPNPITEFDDLLSLGFLPQMLDNVRKLGFITPTPVQMQSIPVMMSRNVLVCAPTGSGKTLAYVLPILNDLRQHKSVGARALILVPTRELSRQVFGDIKALCAEMSLRVGNDISCDIIVSTPKRVLYNKEIVSPSVRWLVADECDKLFEVGSFRQQFADVYALCTNPKLKRCFFSATFGEEVEDWCKLNVDDVVLLYVGDCNCTVQQRMLFVSDNIGKLFALRGLFRSGIKIPALIFVHSRECADVLLNELLFDEIAVDVLHSGRSLKERDQIVEKFRLGGISALICTDLVARGMDFSAVNLVVNYDMPKSSVDYIHRIGRTGRAGRRGEALTFYTQEDMENGLDHITKLIKSKSTVPSYLKKSKKRKEILNVSPGNARKRKDKMIAPSRTKRRV